MVKLWIFLTDKLAEKNYLLVCNVDEFDMPVHVVFVHIAILRAKFFISVFPVSVLHGSGDFLSVAAVKNPGLYEARTTLNTWNTTDIIYCI